MPVHVYTCMDVHACVLSTSRWEPPWLCLQPCVGHTTVPTYKVDLMTMILSVSVPSKWTNSDWWLCIRTARKACGLNFIYVEIKLGWTGLFVATVGGSNLFFIVNADCFPLKAALTSPPVFCSLRASRVMVLNGISLIMGVKKVKWVRFCLVFLVFDLDYCHCYCSSKEGIYSYFLWIIYSGKIIYWTSTLQ